MRLWLAGPAQRSGRREFVESTRAANVADIYVLVFTPSRQARLARSALEEAAFIFGAKAVAAPQPSSKPRRLRQRARACNLLQFNSIGRRALRQPAVLRGFAADVCPYPWLRED
jgi:hypothetical protein